MFTGIIQQLGTVVSIDPSANGMRLCIDGGDWLHSPQMGESIAVDGCCLTLAVPAEQVGRAAGAALMWFDVVPQTLRMTTLGVIKPGDPVNLERAVTASTLIGGHIVQGHIDGVGVVKQVLKGSDEWRVRVEPPESLMDVIVDKGSIAINGVSLTVAHADSKWFEVALIPTTLKLTNLNSLREGMKVNLEGDYIAKTVVSWLRRQQSG